MKGIVASLSFSKDGGLVLYISTKEAINGVLAVYIQTYQQGYAGWNTRFKEILGISRSKSTMETVMFQNKSDSPAAIILESAALDPCQMCLILLLYL